MEQLTPRQQQVLDYIESHIGQHGYPPTLREIAAHLGISGTLGVMKHLQALEKKGYIEKDVASSRGIRLSGRPKETISLPIVGRVAAGSLQPALENIEEHFGIERGRARQGDFMLRVRGDSMIEAGILDGDLVQIRPQNTACNGEIVVVLVNDEATRKRFYREGDRIRLQPENRELEPILLRAGDGEIGIVGKVVGLYREF